VIGRFVWGVLSVLLELVGASLAGVEGLFLEFEDSFLP